MNCLLFLGRSVKCAVEQNKNRLSRLRLGACCGNSLKLSCLTSGLLPAQRLAPDVTTIETINSTGNPNSPVSAGFALENRSEVRLSWPGYRKIPRYVLVTKPRLLRTIRVELRSTGQKQDLQSQLHRPTPTMSQPGLGAIWRRVATSASSFGPTSGPPTKEESFSSA